MRNFQMYLSNHLPRLGSVIIIASEGNLSDGEEFLEVIVLMPDCRDHHLLMCRTTLSINDIPHETTDEIAAGLKKDLVLDQARGLVNDRLIKLYGDTKNMDYLNVAVNFTPDPNGENTLPSLWMREKCRNEINKIMEFTQCEKLKDHLRMIQQLPPIKAEWFDPQAR